MKNAIPGQPRRMASIGILTPHLPVVLFYVVTVAPEELIDALVICGYFETLG